jgi:hypothetical protein
MTVKAHRPGPDYLSMSEAAQALGGTRDAARKRFKRNGVPLVRVGGEHFVNQRHLRDMLPYGVIESGWLSTTDAAKLMGLGVQGARLRLQRDGAVRRLGGRWVTSRRLLAAAYPSIALRLALGEM